MRKAITIALILTVAQIYSVAGNSIYAPNIKTLQVVVNQDWLSPISVLRLGTDDILHVSFDELSHDYHRYTYRIERHEVDWQQSEEVFESDWLEGFNDNIIEDYSPSINTIIPYTHYLFHLPNDHCRLKLSGNYRLKIVEDDIVVASVDFIVTEETMSLELQATTNTDIDMNQSHQQVDVTLNYGKVLVTNPSEQIKLVVMQNGREDNKRYHIQPTFRNLNGLKWEHCHDLIFNAGNEYRKYEILDPSHPTMGIEYIDWDGKAYQAYPFIDEPRPNYIYDEDANGAFYIRNSDNDENDISSEYVYVNYRLKMDELPYGEIYINGCWTTELPESYKMTYNESEKQYNANILQKQGYYSYQYLWNTQDNLRYLPTEGNFYQTENRYQALIYYKGTGERTWRLTAFRGIQLASYGTHDRTMQ